MSWTYSGSPLNSLKDECRFLTGDTNPDEPIMQDEEIEYLIEAANGNDNQLKYNLFRQAATIFARDIKRSLGPQSEDPTQRLKYFTDQADFYKSRLASVGLSLPKNNYPPIFRKGMHSNPPWPPAKGGIHV